MKSLSLNGIWSLRGRRQGSSDEMLRLDATVPGCVQLDLAAAGHLPNDLYFGENILEAEKFEDYEWIYERSFTAPEERKNLFLVFEGVDCIAEYFLNGKRIGESDNMLISHEFRVDEYMCDGENTLTVHIKSATLAAIREDYPIRLLHSINIDGCHIRKAPHSFGWDIMPRAVTAGLWRGVRLEVRDEMYFSQAYVYARTDKCAFYYTIAADAYFSHGIEVELEGASSDSHFKIRKASKGTRA